MLLVIVTLFQSLRSQHSSSQLCFELYLCSTSTCIHLLPTIPPTTLPFVSTYVTPLLVQLFFLLGLFGNYFAMYKICYQYILLRTCVLTNHDKFRTSLSSFMLRLFSYSLSEAIQLILITFTHVQVIPIYKKHGFSTDPHSYYDVKLDMCII